MTLKLRKSEIWIIISLCTYLLMNGAQLWETFIIIPSWTAAPPESLLFFSQPYGLDFKNFWIVMHSIHEVAFILAIIFSWRLAKRRNFLLIMFALHMGVRIWTLAYFVPNIIEFQGLSELTGIDPELQARTIEWRNLNYLRVALFFLINILCFYALKLNRHEEK